MPRTSGRLTDAQVVINLKRDVTEFQEAVIEQINTLKARAESMADVWRDSQYTAFMSYIDELSAGLKNDVQQLDYAVKALEKEIR
jgi:hypothetical protein